MKNCFRLFNLSNLTDPQCLYGNRPAISINKFDLKTRLLPVNHGHCPHITPKQMSSRQINQQGH